MGRDNMNAVYLLIIDDLSILSLCILRLDLQGFQFPINIYKFIAEIQEVYAHGRMVES